MLRRHARLLPFALLGSALLVVGCDSDPDRFKVEEKKKPKEKEYTAEELKEAREKAGFKTQDEIMAEAKAEYEKTEKAYVKRNLEHFRKVVTDMTALLDEIEKGSAEWATSEKKFEKFEKGLKDRAKQLKDDYWRATNKMQNGGNAAAALSGTYQEWEVLKGGLGPKIAENERFTETLKSIRAGLADVTKQLDEIEKDDTIEAGEPADAEGADGKGEDDKKKK